MTVWPVSEAVIPVRALFSRAPCDGRSRMRIENPYHEGELMVQERVGVLEEGKRNAAAIADSIVK